MRLVPANKGLSPIVPHNKGVSVGWWPAVVSCQLLEDAARDVAEPKQTHCFNCDKFRATY